VWLLYVFNSYSIRLRLRLREQESVPFLFLASSYFVRFVVFTNMNESPSYTVGRSSNTNLTGSMECPNPINWRKSDIDEEWVTLQFGMGFNGKFSTRTC